MIISREQRLNDAVNNSFSNLKRLLSVGRGTSEARTELKLLRDSSLVDNTCPYCGKHITDRSQRRSEACLECANRIDRMLMMKSKILRTVNPIGADGAFDTFVNDYEMLHYVPIALGGADNSQEIIDTCKEYKIAFDELRAFNKEKAKQKTLENIKARRMEKLRVEYSRYIGTMSTEEFNDMLETQYVQRYYQNVM